MMAEFVFRITGICDKRCPTCCCRNSISALSPDAFRKKLDEIHEFSARGGDHPVICITGGEPFLYRTHDETGRWWNIVDLVIAIRHTLPDALIVVKTSGWTRHRLLDNLLNALASSISGKSLDVRLGFNLYQNNGAKAEERLGNMISSILKYQPSIRIETIFDSGNRVATFEIIDRVLFNIGGLNTNLLEMMASPERGWRFTIPVRYEPLAKTCAHEDEKRIILYSMPAHPGFAKRSADGFIEAENNQPCPMISGTLKSIMYEPDLSFRHCNDAFADYSLSAFKNRFSTIDAQFEFLENKFALLRDHLESAKIAFRFRKERCDYCSRFLHQSE